MLIINGRAAVYQNSQALLQVINPCWLPGQRGQAAAPYPCQATPRDAVQCALSVFYNDRPLCHAQSQFARSYGDDASDGGVYSQTKGGSAVFLTHSANVFIEGVPAVRCGDQMIANQHNSTVGPLLAKQIARSDSLPHTSKKQSQAEHTFILTIHLIGIMQQPLTAQLQVRGGSWVSAIELPRQGQKHYTLPAAKEVQLWLCHTSDENKMLDRLLIRTEVSDNQTVMIVLRICYPIRITDRRQRQFAHCQPGWLYWYRSQTLWRKIYIDENNRYYECLLESLTDQTRLQSYEQDMLLLPEAQHELSYSFAKVQWSLAKQHNIDQVAARLQSLEVDTEPAALRTLLDIESSVPPQQASGLYRFEAFDYTDKVWCCLVQDPISVIEFYLKLLDYYCARLHSMIGHAAASPWFMIAQVTWSLVQRKAHWQALVDENRLDIISQHSAITKITRKIMACARVLNFYSQHGLVYSAVSSLKRLEQYLWHHVQDLLESSHDYGTAIDLISRWLASWLVMRQAQRLSQFMMDNQWISKVLFEPNAKQRQHLAKDQFKRSVSLCKRLAHLIMVDSHWQTVYHGYFDRLIRWQQPTWQLQWLTSSSQPHTNLTQHQRGMLNLTWPEKSHKVLAQWHLKVTHEKPLPVMTFLQHHQSHISHTATHLLLALGFVSLAIELKQHHPHFQEKAKLAATASLTSSYLVSQWLLLSHQQGILLKASATSLHLISSMLILPYTLKQTQKALKRRDKIAILSQTMSLAAITTLSMSQLLSLAKTVATQTAPVSVQSSSEQALLMRLWQARQKFNVPIKQLSARYFAPALETLAGIAQQPVGIGVLGLGLELVDWLACCGLIFALSEGVITMMQPLTPLELWLAHGPFGKQPQQRFLSHHQGGKREWALWKQPHNALQGLMQCIVSVKLVPQYYQQAGLLQLRLTLPNHLLNHPLDWEYHIQAHYHDRYNNRLIKKSLFIVDPPKLIILASQEVQWCFEISLLKNSDQLPQRASQAMQALCDNTGLTIRIRWCLIVNAEKPYYFPAVLTQQGPVVDYAECEVVC